MLQSVEDISPTKKRLRIEIPSDVIEREIKDSLEKLRQRMRIPGFRPGKAPLNLIEKRFGNEVNAEVFEKVIPEFFSRALMEANVNPITPPVFDEKPEFRRNNPIHLSITVEVMPNIENLHYEDIRAKDIPVTVEDADLEDALKKVAGEKAVYEVAEKEIEMDDLVNFDFVDCEVVGEETTPSMKERVSQMGNEMFPPDILEKMIGKKKGDISEFTTTFDKTLSSKELAGKTANIKVIIKEIKKKILPSIDDEFAKDLGFENLSKLQERVKENIYRLKKEQAEKLQKADILNTMIESYHFEVPETLFTNELDTLIMEAQMSDKRSKIKDGVNTMQITPEAIEALQTLKDDEALQAELKEKALKNVKASIIVGAIGKKEGIVVTDDEINERILTLAQRLSSKPDVIRNFYKMRDGSLEGLRQSIFEDKVLDMLLSKAVLEKGE